MFDHLKSNSRTRQHVWEVTWKKIKMLFLLFDVDDVKIKTLNFVKIVVSTLLFLIGIIASSW